MNNKCIILVDGLTHEASITNKILVMLNTEYKLLFQISSDGLCTWLNNVPAWFVVVICTTYFVILSFVVFVYAVILVRFRQSSKNYKKLQKKEIEGKNKF